MEGPTSLLAQMCPKDELMQGWVSTDTTQKGDLGWKTGNVPFIVIPHSISFRIMES